MNITLIGMPGCGKSTIGKELAYTLGMAFVDVDQVIMEAEHRTLAQILDEDGIAGFRAVENRVNANLQPEHAVIAPGGSVVYCDEAMEHLREISKIVYLHVPLETLTERLGDLHERGVSMAPGQTIADLWEERRPLYRRYAHVTVSTEGLSIAQSISAIRRLLKV